RGSARPRRALRAAQRPAHRQGLHPAPQPDLRPGHAGPAAAGAGGGAARRLRGPSEVRSLRGDARGHTTGKVVEFQCDPSDFDPRRTYTDLEPHLALLRSEKQRANLRTVIDHARGEVERDLDLIMGPLQDGAKYHFWSWQEAEDAPKGNANI